MNSMPLIKKFKIEWFEVGDNPEDIVTEVYVRTAKNIVSLFLLEVERRTGRHVISFEMFCDDVNKIDNATITLDTQSEILIYENPKNGIYCKVALFKTIT